MQFLHARWGRRAAPQVGQVFRLGVSSFHTELRRLFLRCLDTLLLGTAIFDTSLWVNVHRHLSTLLVKELCQSGQAGIHLFFAAAGFHIQIRAASGAKTLTVLFTEVLCVQIEDKHIGHQLVQVQLVILQENDLVILFILQLSGEKGLVMDPLLPGVGLGTAGHR